MVILRRAQGLRFNANVSGFLVCWSGSVLRVQGSEFNAQGLIQEGAGFRLSARLRVAVQGSSFKHQVFFAEGALLKVRQAPGAKLKA